MLHFFSGTDRAKARAAMDAAVSAKGGSASGGKKSARIVRITDVNTPADLTSALQGGGMFNEARVVVLDGVFANEEMAALALRALPLMKDSSEPFFILEEKPLADIRKKIEKYAETRERFDAPSKGKDNSIFALAGALRRGDRKALWIGYQRELAKGTAPEAIHGVFFWAVKNAFLSANTASDRSRGALLLATLAKLPHEARRRGEDLEYALELFALSEA